MAPPTSKRRGTRRLVTVLPFALVAAVIFAVSSDLGKGNPLMANLVHVRHRQHLRLYLLQQQRHLHETLKQRHQHQLPHERLVVNAVAGAAHQEGDVHDEEAPTRNSERQRREPEQQPRQEKQQPEVKRTGRLTLMRGKGVGYNLEVNHPCAKAVLSSIPAPSTAWRDPRDIAPDHPMPVLTNITGGEWGRVPLHVLAPDLKSLKVPSR